MILNLLPQWGVKPFLRNYNLKYLRYKHAHAISNDE